jgi:hypothetical protein
MEKQIENILIKVDEGTMPVQQALSELLRLFNVSGSLPLAKMEKKLDEALSKETPESLDKWLKGKRQ